MKESFDKKQHDQFIKYFDIKENPSEIEIWFYKKTEKYIKYIKWLPWLKMIWIWNSISMNTATSSSDIDLYIVSDKKTMWYNRVIITIVFQLLWVRKTAKKHAWRFCLSFFSTLEWMDFSNFKIKNDIYLYFWILYFKPILNNDNTYELFLEKNNSWADFSKYNNLLEKNKNYIKYKWKKRKICIYIEFINKITKKIFLQKTLKKYNQIWKPYWVIINNNILKFHNWDIRETIKKELV